MIEVIGFVGLYFFSSYGLKVHRKEYDKIIFLQQDMDRLIIEIDRLEKEIKDLESCSFYKEKIAREELHMAYPNEIIYYTN